MKSFKKVTAAALICALLMSMPGLGALASTEPVATLEEPALVNTDQEQKNYTSAAADFSIKLFQNSMDSQKNSVISPLSVYLALGMTANGASHETLNQFESVLGGGKVSLEEINRYNSELIYALRSNDDRKLRIADSIWFDTAKDLTVNQSFLDKNSQYYGAGIFQQNFKDPATMEQINGWVSDNTEGKIPAILDEMDQDAIMYLINTVLFEANWMVPYNESQVAPGTFHAASGDQNATFMTSKETYLKDGGAQGMMKYFKDGRMALTAVLPPAGLSAEQYVKSLTGDKWLSLMESAGVEEANSHLPKFKFEYEKKLAQPLQQMGLTNAFDVQKADFTELGSYTNRNISVNEVLHKAFIEVDEAGAKAGAATAVEMIARMSMPVGEPVELWFDQPFVCAIVDTETNLPLFLGVVQNPTAEG